MNPLEFENLLTKGDYFSPIARHIVLQHSILYHAGVRGDAMAVAEHSLREMFTATAQYRGPYADLRPERLDADWSKSLVGSIKKAADEVVVSLRSMRLARTEPLTPEQRDRRSERNFRVKIENERKAGLAYVRAEGRRISKEAGL